MDEGRSTHSDDPSSTSTISTYDGDDGSGVGALFMVARNMYDMREMRADKRRVVRAPDASIIATAGATYTTHLFNATEPGPGAATPLRRMLAEFVAGATLSDSRRKARGLVDVGQFKRCNVKRLLEKGLAGTNSKRMKPLMKPPVPVSETLESSVVKPGSYGLQSLEAITCEASALSIPFDPARAKLLARALQSLRKREPSSRYVAAYAVAILSTSCAWTASFMGHPASQQEYVGWLTDATSSIGTPLELAVEAILYDLFDDICIPSEDAMHQFLGKPEGIRSSVLARHVFRDTAVRTAKSLAPVFSGMRAKYAAAKRSDALVYMAVSHASLMMRTSDRFAFASEGLLAFLATTPNLHIGIPRLEMYTDTCGDSRACTDKAEQLRQAFLDVASAASRDAATLEPEDTQHADCKRVALDSTRAAGALTSSLESYAGETDCGLELIPVLATRLVPGCANVFVDRFTSHAERSRTSCQYRQVATMTANRLLGRMFDKIRVTSLEGHYRVDSSTTGSVDGRGVTSIRSCEWTMNGSALRSTVQLSSIVPGNAQHAKKTSVDFADSCSLKLAEGWGRLLDMRLECEDVINDDAEASSANELEAAHERRALCDTETSPRAYVAQLVQHCVLLAMRRQIGTPMHLLAYPSQAHFLV